MTSPRPIQGGGKQPPSKLERQRKSLLALVHIAKAQLVLSRTEYERELAGLFGVTSAAALSVGELERLVTHFQGMGFVRTRRPKNFAGQADALRGRIRKEAGKFRDGQERLRGLVQAKAGVDDLRFVKDVPQLMTLLAIIGQIRRGENADDARHCATGQ